MGEASKAQSKVNIGKIKELYFDTNLRNKHQSFRDLLKASTIPTPDKAYQETVQLVEKDILAVVQRLSDIQYYIMEKTGDWGEYGQQRVVIGYARLKLNIAPEDEITQRDINEFQAIMTRNHELRNLSVEQLKLMDRDTAHFNVLDKKIHIEKTNIINRELKFLGSSVRVSVGRYGRYRSIIMGEGKNIKREGYDVILYEKETARTPTNIMSIAAVIGSHDIGIRKESCRLIFEMKWKKMFEYTEREKSRMYNNEAGNIREMIKVKALDAYKVNSVEEIEAIKDLFIEEMIEGIIWHEFGHGIFFNDMLDIETSAQSKAFNYYGENIVCILHEVLADWAPRQNKLKGPMQHFMELAEKDQEKAYRMLLVYMSDNWFLDYKEEFLGAQTDLMISILMPFVTEHSIQWNALKERYQQIFDFMFNSSLSIIKEVSRMMMRATYRPYKYDRDFNFIEQKIHEALKKDEKMKGTLEYASAFWLNAAGYCEKFATPTYRQILEFLKTQERDVYKRLLELIDKEAAPRYGDGIRDYLFEQMKVKGFFREVTQLTPMDGVRMALEEIDVFQDERAGILERYQSVYDGKETCTAHINYDDSFSFFNCALQEMLIATQLGEINKEVSVRNDRVVILQKGQEKAHVTEGVLQEKIDELTSLFEERKLLSILTLKVNTELTDMDTWYSLLAASKLKDGSLLIQKIDHVTGEMMDSHVIFSFQPPIEYGYMCYSTVKAIEKINSLLRDDFDKDKYRIDKTFLDYLTLEYNNTY